MARCVVFKHQDDILELKSLLFGSYNDQKIGLAKCKALEVRGPLPTSVHTTCLLISVLHNDIPGVDLWAIRQAYSMALIRFVNETLDAAQVAKNVIPLHALAQQCDLPNSFVEIRHAATHEDLPSIYLLREMCHKALNWLDRKYWAKQVPESSSTQSTPIPPNPDTSGLIKTYLKEWRRMKREDAQVAVPLELTAKLAQEFKYHETNFLEVLLNRNILVPAGTSPLPKRGQAVINLWMPLFHTLGTAFLDKVGSMVLTELSNRQWPLISETSDQARKFTILELWAENLAPFFTADTFKLTNLPRPWNCEIIAIYANANKLKVEFEKAEMMAEMMDCILRTQYTPGNSNWKKVTGWFPKPIGVL